MVPWVTKWGSTHLFAGNGWSYRFQFSLCDGLHDVVLRGHLVPVPLLLVYGLGWHCQNSGCLVRTRTQWHCDGLRQYKLSIRWSFGHSVRWILGDPRRGLARPIIYPALVLSGIWIWSFLASKDSPQDVVPGTRFGQGEGENSAIFEREYAETEVSIPDVIRTLFQIELFRLLLVYSFFTTLLRSIFIFWMPKFFVDLGLGASTAILKSAPLPIARMHRNDRPRLVHRPLREKWRPGPSHVDYATLSHRISTQYRLGGVRGSTQSHSHSLPHRSVRFFSFGSLFHEFGLLDFGYRWLQRGRQLHWNHRWHRLHWRSLVRLGSRQNLR